MAASATLHCLTGCAIGEILGLMIGTAFGLSTGSTIGLAVAFVAALPVNRCMLSKGTGHALTHQYHHAGHEGDDACHDHADQDHKRHDMRADTPTTDHRDAHPSPTESTSRD
jgi:hypothetical protein